MLFTLTTTTSPARDLSLLLRKHPDRVQTFPLPFGAAHVVYPEATDERCTAALVLDIDPVSLVRGRPTSSGDGGLVDAYVNDRPYAASSFLSVAMARVLGSALRANGDDAAAARVFSLEAHVVPVRAADADLPRRLFEPLGYHVETTPVGEATTRFVELTLRGETTVSAMLTHLYVLIPVLDAEKHYWVGDEEVEKLFRHGGEWLPAHPEAEFITRRYLRRAPMLARAAVARLAAIDESSAHEDRGATTEELVERPMRLQERRLAAAIDALHEAGARSVVDLGCGDGDLVIALARDLRFDRVLGVDVAARELQRARERYDRVPMATSRREKISFVQGSVLYADARTGGFDAATLLEVIEHVDVSRLAALERAVFASARPKTVVLSTPNAEYNVLFPTLAQGAMRHPDHRFEWDRATFADWAAGVALRNGYTVTFRPVGDVDPSVGPPTQMAVFTCN